MFQKEVNNAIQEAIKSGACTKKSCILNNEMMVDNVV